MPHQRVQRASRPPTSATAQRPRTIREREALIAFAILIGAGMVLRLLLIGNVSPAFAGPPDAAYYMLLAHDGVFVSAANPSFSPWPAGYPVFLHLLAGVAPQISFAIFVQHLLGLATAVVLFMAVRRVVSAWWALLPAAVILLAGPQLFLEHSPMSEALFTFLVAIVLYAAIRAYDGANWWWAAVAGFTLAYAGCVRVQGLTLAVVLFVWLLVGVRAPVRARLIAVAAAAACFSLVIGVYLAEMKRQTGYGGPALTRSGSYGAPDGGRPDRSIERIAPDLIRLWNSDANFDNGGLGYGGFIEGLTTPQGTDVFYEAARDYPTLTLATAGSALPFLKGYERRTRLQGVPFTLLLLLALGGLVPARGRRLHLSLLVVATALAMVMAPLVFAQYDARYIVPAYGMLAAAGAIGGATLRETVAPRLRRTRLPGRAPSYAE